MQVTECLFDIVMMDTSIAKIKSTGNKSKSPYKNLKYDFSYYGIENIVRRSGNKYWIMKGTPYFSYKDSTPRIVFLFKTKN